MTIFLTGIARISHIDRTLAGETALARCWAWTASPPAIPSTPCWARSPPGTSSNWTASTRTYLDEQAHFEQGTVIADLDLSVKSTEGRKRQGATPGYNPKHKGRDCYQWAVAFASGLVVWQQLCRGSTSGQGLVGTALEALRQRMPHLAILRLDGGFLSAKVLNLLVSQHVGFLTKAGSKLVSVRTLLEQTRAEQWQSLRREHPAVPLESGPVARRLPHAGDGGPGGVPPPDQEAEEGAAVLEDPDLPLRHRDRPAPLDDGEDLRDLQGAMGGGELLQGIEPVVQFGQAAVEPVPGQPVLPGVAGAWCTT